MTPRDGLMIVDGTGDVGGLEQGLGLDEIPGGGAGEEGVFSPTRAR